MEEIMKIEIGESLAMSYLKHVEKCTFYQTNWKVSSNWSISNETFDKVQYIYNKIINHSEFSDIFKSELDQLIKQSEIDVIGLNQNGIIYTIDVAFHEAGLQYSNHKEKTKIETRNRVFKKLLRSYLTVLTYFPKNKYELLFISPKVNPATDKIILDYFKMLENDFSDENVRFRYFSNDRFLENILSPTLSKSINDRDTNELFIRAIILNNLFERSSITTGNDDDELILEFIPSDEKIFKMKLIETKKAKRTIYYKNKNKNPKIETWNADKLTEESNLRGNIHSKFRKWKELEIEKIKFEILNDVRANGV
jgi:hypothetical protein